MVILVSLNRAVLLVLDEFTLSALCCVFRYGSSFSCLWQNQLWNIAWQMYT